METKKKDTQIVQDAHISFYEKQGQYALTSIDKGGYTSGYIEGYLAAIKESAPTLHRQNEPK